MRACPGAEKRPPRFYHEDAERNNLQLVWNPTVQNVPCVFEKEVYDNEASDQISQPPWFTSKINDDASFRAMLHRYPVHSMQEMPIFPKRNLQDKASQTMDPPLPNDSGPVDSREFQPSDLHQLQEMASSNGDAGNCRSCPTHCPSAHRKSQHFTADLKQRRPTIIMVPVKHDNSDFPEVTHVPLQSKDDTDFETGERYLRKRMDKMSARFKLTESDWERIPLRNFPGGGRLLGGDWTRIFHSKLKQSNPWCSLRFKNNHVRSINSRKSQSAPFFRGSGECKLPECGVTLKFFIREEKGKCVEVNYFGNVCHKVKK